MKFFIQENLIDQNSSLVYREKDYSFDMDPHDGIGFTSILINDLQLEIDEEGKIMYVWGLCPLIKYNETDEFPKKYKSNSLVALLPSSPIPGISYRLNEHIRWPIHINKKKGWICIGKLSMDNKQMIEFAPNCIATLDHNELIAIWLKPKTMPKDIKL